MKTWQDRLKKEHSKLEKKHLKLLAFLGTAEFESLEPRDKDLLRQQELAMCEYREVLIQRIERLRTEP